MYNRSGMKTVQACSAECKDFIVKAKSWSFQCAGVKYILVLPLVFFNSVPPHLFKTLVLEISSGHSEFDSILLYHL